MMHDVAHQVRPEAPIAVLSGPTFAHEVAAGLPTAITLAAEQELGERLARRLARPSFRPYVSTDVVGAEVGGAVKNVLAIACGVVEGMGLGLNARASLISRGFAEMSRFGLALGARPETLAGLAGLGDLVLTCTSTNSRNFSLGKGIGEGAQRGRSARRSAARSRKARRRRRCCGGWPSSAASRCRSSRRSALCSTGACRRATRSRCCWRGRCGRKASEVLPSEIPADAVILPIAIAGGLVSLRAAGLARRRRLPASARAAAGSWRDGRAL